MEKRWREIERDIDVEIEREREREREREIETDTEIVNTKGKNGIYRSCIRKNSIYSFHNTSRPSKDPQLMA